jgi:hypothetical protein
MSSSKKNPHLTGSAVTAHSTVFIPRKSVFRPSRTQKKLPSNLVKRVSNDVVAKRSYYRALPNELIIIV